MRRSPDEFRVLYVDNDQEYAARVAEYLHEHLEVEVRTEPDPEAGIAALEEMHFECVVSEYEMSARDGLEFLEAVREAYPDLPFILFTDRGSEAIASQAIAAGVTDYLPKDSGTDEYAVLVTRIENAVHRSQAESRGRQGFEALESAREGISLLDDEGYFTYVNEAFADLVGYEQDALIGEHWELLYPDEHVDRVYEEILPSIPADGRWTGQTVYRRSDGDRILVDHALTECQSGSYFCLVAEMSAGDNDGPLVAEEAFVECLLDALEDVFYVLDTSGSIVRVNQRAVEVTGYTEDELTSMHAAEVFAATDRPEVEEAIGTTLEGDTSCVELDVLTSDGTQLPYEFRTRRLTDLEGETMGLVGIGRDVAERRRRERQLERQAQQFESFGSVLSHDLRTPLSTLSGRLQLAEETGDAEHFRAAESAIDRLDTLIDDLSRVMREGQLADEPTEVDLTTLARETWETVETEGAALTIESPPVVYAGENALRRLFENLFRNAAEHGGSNVTVRVGRVQGGFYVEDDGGGIPPADREAIFEPGFTSKQEGAGLGMVSVRQITLAHGWDLTVSDSESGGARFEFRDVQTV